MKHVTEYHSCYDELLSMLLNKQKSNNNDKKVNLVTNAGKETTLTAQEIILYSLLLHKCIESNFQQETITYKELQELRNKRVGKVEILDIFTYEAFNKSFRGLCTKYVDYDLKESRLKSKISHRKEKHPLVIIRSVKTNGTNKLISYSLGPFGKTLIESKRYSTLVPSKYFQVRFKEIMKYELALYVCKILYLERRKKKDSITIKLPTIMKNINKYQTIDNQLVRLSNCLEYHGPNIKRLWELMRNSVNELLYELKCEYKIKDYDIQIPNSINNYKDIKWKILVDK